MKSWLFIFAIALSSFLSAQDSTGRFVHKGLWRAEATFTPGIFLKSGLTATYLSGNLEYYFHENVSFRGDGYYFLGFLGEQKPLVFNNSILAGASFHIPTSNHLDPYVYFQPGLAIAQSNELKACMCTPVGFIVAIKSSVSANPLLSVGTGVNLYFQKVFHIFGEVRYTYGNHQANYPARSLSDLKFSFGLGFNIL